MKIKNPESSVGPILALFILAPVIAELLFGSTPVSRSPQLIMESFYYGSGAMLVREIVRRHNLGWLSVIVLGIAFGIIEECITLQSVFNPHFLGNNLTYGRMWGVNWVWGMCIIGYHAVWSITIPILFAELLFPGRKDRPWLNNAGIWLITGIYMLSTVAFYAFFKKISGFESGLIHKVIAGVFAFILIVLSLYLPVFVRFKHIFKKTPSYFAGIIGFIGSSLWFVLLLLVFKPDSHVYPWLAMAGGLLLILIVLSVLMSWPDQNWNDNNRLFLAGGCLYASMIFGLNTLSGSKNNLDISFQIFFIVLVTVLLIVLKRHINKLSSETH